MKSKLLLIVIDGVPYRNFRRYFGNLEAWAEAGTAQSWRIAAPLPSISAPCYASIHSGATPVQHGITSNSDVRRVDLPDIFSEVRRNGGITGAVTHSYWSEMFNRTPFEPIRDIEYDEPESTSICHGRFHTMTGYTLANAMTPSDADLFATLSMLIARFELDYGILHSCTLDSAGHQFGHECTQMDNACALLDAQLAPYIRHWRALDYEVIVTADHGQSERGHHGGAGTDQQDTALYYFGPAKGPEPDTFLRLTQIAPTVLTRLGLAPPATMTGESFLAG